MTVLKPQDLAVLLKLIALVIGVDAQITGKRNWTYESLSHQLLLSASETHAALKRAEYAKLFDSTNRTVRLANFEDLMLHGIQYVYFVRIGAETRGIPTSFAAPPLVHAHFDDADRIPVWPHHLGVKRGYAIEPLYKNAPEAGIDQDFYELLALTDALREGGARVRNRAVEQLKLRFEEYRQYVSKAK